MKLNEFHSNSLDFIQQFTQIRSILLEIGSIRVKQMTGHLNDWTHGDLYELCQDSLDMSALFRYSVLI